MDVLNLKDGSATSICTFREFVELVERFMGGDAREFLEQWTADNLSDTDEPEKETDSLERELDMLRDGQHELLLNIREEASGLLDLLAEPRMNREELRKAASEIYCIVNDEL